MSQWELSTLFQLPSVSYINLDFPLADYSPCHLFSRWFLSELIFSTLKIEAICSSETSPDTQQTTRRYIPEDCTLLNIFIKIYNAQEFSI
jgi:hypothetical protein